ncbi:hypothetical protein ACFLTQ_02475 [Chloroflexota bacterium]
MGINELEKVVRETADKRDLHSIEESTLSPEFADAARTLARRRGKRNAAMNLLNPTIAAWL